MENEFVFDADRTPIKGAGRHSCLSILLIVLLVAVLAIGSLFGILYLTGRSGLFSFGPSIGVIEFTGVIEDSKAFLERLNEFGQDEQIKAIILRIDSPGGGVAATQEIYKEILRIRENKSVIASLGSVAASGGLYIASAANLIIANPATVTGSIGVIMQTVNLQELMGKIGVRPVVIKSGKYKDIGSYSRPMTDEERALLQGVVDELHGQFVRDVANSRGIEPASVAAIADGRIFTGEQAIQLHLVDKLGNFLDAVDQAKEIAGIKGVPHLIYPPSDDSWWVNIMQRFGMGGKWPNWQNHPISFQFLYLPELQPYYLRKSIGATMVKREIISELVRRHKDIKIRDIDMMARFVFETLAEALTRGEDIEIRGLGTFRLKAYPPRCARNPGTGETVSLSRRQNVLFRMSREMKERLNGENWKP